MNISKTITEGINILKENEIRNPQLDVEILLSKLIRKEFFEPVSAKSVNQFLGLNI